MSQKTSVSVINEDLRADYTVFPIGISISGHIKKYKTFSEMKSDRNPPKYAWVENAADDPTVGKGSALYYNKTGNVWVKLYETESIDMDLDDLITKPHWYDIVGGPTASPEEIDLAVTNKHIHDNYTVLCKLKQNDVGRLVYNNDELMINDGTLVTLSAKAERHDAWIALYTDNISSITSSLNECVHTVAQHTSNITNINSDILNIGVSIDGLRAVVETADSKITVNANNIVTLLNRIITVESWKDDIDSWKTTINALDLSSIWPRITTIETTISTTNANLRSISGRVDDVEESISVHGNTIQSMSTNLNTISDIVDSHVDAIVSLTTTVDTKASVNSVNAIDTRVSALEQWKATVDDSFDTTEIYERMDAIEANIPTFYQKVTKHDADISELTTKVDTYHDRIEEVASSIPDLVTRIGSVESGLNDTNSKVTAAEQNIVDITFNIADMHTDITQINSRLDGHDTDISGLKTKNDEQDSAIESHGEKIVALESNVTTITSVVADNHNEIVEIKSDTSNLNSRLGVLEEKVQINTDDIALIKDEILGSRAEADAIDRMV